MIALLFGCVTARYWRRVRVLESWCGPAWARAGTSCRPELRSPVAAARVTSIGDGGHRHRADTGAQGTVGWGAHLGVPARADAAREFTDAFAGAGSLRSSANDLLTFLAANLGYTKTPLAPAMTRMLAVRLGGRGKSDIGLAWNVDHRDGAEIVWHGGATYGSRAFMGFDPKARVGVVVLSNYSTGSGIDDIGIHLLDRGSKVDNGTAVKPRVRAVSAAPAVSLEAYAGRYQFSDNQVWVVRREGTRFFLKRPSEPEFEIFPEGDFQKGNDDFFSKGEDALLTFEFDKDTNVRASQLTFSWGFFEPRRAKRVE